MGQDCQSILIQASEEDILFPETEVWAVQKCNKRGLRLLYLQVAISVTCLSKDYKVNFFSFYMAFKPNVFKDGMPYFIVSKVWFYIHLT